jgi:hypothetical protein
VIENLFRFSITNNMVGGLLRKAISLIALPDSSRARAS